MSKRKLVIIGGDAAGMTSPPFSPVWDPVQIAARTMI